MTDLWNDVGDAIVAKIVASASLATAGLRGADGDIDDPPASATPRIKLLNPVFTPGDEQNARVSEYTLEFPFELLVPIPNGKKRSGPIAASIMRALQLEWRSGFKLGLDSSLDVVDSHLGPSSPGLSVYDASNLDGYTGSFIVQVYETHSARTP